jgi:hypothetical protein
MFNRQRGFFKARERPRAASSAWGGWIRKFDDLALVVTFAELGSVEQSQQFADVIHRRFNGDIRAMNAISGRSSSPMSYTIIQIASVVRQQER